MSEKIYDMVTLETIEKLADLVAAKDLGEITIASEDKCITIKGKKCPPPMPPMGVPMLRRLPLRQLLHLLRLPQRRRSPSAARSSSRPSWAHSTPLPLRISLPLYRWATL